MDIVTYALLKGKISGVESQVSGLAEGFDYKGSVASVSDLPNNASQGDMYTVDGRKYVWDGEEWVELTYSVEIDTTLTESGKAADAKAVGDALDTKVPTSRKINNKSLTGNITLNAGDIGYNGSASYSSGTVGYEVKNTGVKIGNLSDLETTAKSNLVAAINEAAQSGGGGGGDIDSLRSWLSGKKVSIIGDSIDSLNRPGYNPLNYPAYYPNRNVGVSQASETWWYQVIVNSGASIEINASSSGSMVTNNHPDPTTRPDFYARTSLVGNPDIVFVTLGTNDSNSGVALGGYDYATPYEQLSELTFRPAYIKGVKSLQALYPSVQIVCITEFMKPEYKKSILDIANTLGCVFIDASGYDTSTDTQGVHPGILGMMQIASKVLYPTDESLTQKQIPADAKRTGEELAILKKEAIDSNLAINALLTYLFDILRAAEYTSDKSAEIDALEAALEIRTINADYSYGELTLDLFNSTPAWRVPE